MKKQTVGERYGMQQNPPRVIISQIAQDHPGKQQIQQIFTQTKQALAQAHQAANQIKATNPELTQIHGVAQQLAIATNKLKDELSQAGQTLQFIGSSLPSQ